MCNKAIGMFDSGVGGLTVYREVRSKFPNEDIIYLGDTKSFPYGSKSKESIVNLTKQGLDFLLSKDVKAIIIACGTATSQALDVLKDSYPVPVIGIIESTSKYIANCTDMHNIGIVATSGTIKSGCWSNSLLKYRSDLNIINKACPLLAPMAEEGWTDNEIAKLAVHEYMKNMHNIDALILGCTHYPLFANLFKAEISHTCKIINPGKLIANDLENTVQLNPSVSKEGNTTIFLTDTECNFINVATKLLNNKELQIHQAIL